MDLFFVVNIKYGSNLMQLYIKVCEFFHFEKTKMVNNSNVCFMIKLGMEIRFLITYKHFNIILFIRLKTENV